MNPPTFVIHHDDLRDACLLRSAPEGARACARCGTTRTITHTGQALSAETQLLHLPQTLTLRALVSSSAFQLSHVHKMMDSICLDDSSDDADTDWDLVEQGYTGPRTPSTTSDNNVEADTNSRPQHYEHDTSDGSSDNDYGGASQAAPKMKKGGYDSRIEQILYENPDLPILITDAGKSSESGGKYIVYTIRTGVSLQVLLRGIY